MVKTVELTKMYGKITALDHVSFQLDAGGIYGLLGPNGAGKSTTMNLLTGCIRPTEGSIQIAGYDLALRPEFAKQCLGYLPEIPPVYPDMTPKEYLEFAASIKKLSRHDCNSEAQRVMQLTAVDDMQDRLIRSLSKGYRQRVGIACALLGNPPVVILDEPTVGLDPKQIIEVRELISSLKGNHTVIFSSHILSEVRAFCDHVLIISKGKLSAVGTPEELEQKFRKANRIEFTIRTSAKYVFPHLAILPGMVSCQLLDDHTDQCHFLVECEPNTDLREEIFCIACKLNAPLLELHMQQMSLEDVFLELV